MASEEKQDEMVQTAIKVRKSWLARIDKIADSLSTPSLEINRTDAIRVAIHQWMERMETESGAALARSALAMARGEPEKKKR